MLKTGFTLSQSPITPGLRFRFHKVQETPVLIGILNIGRLQWKYYPSGLNLFNRDDIYTLLFG